MRSKKKDKVAATQDIIKENTTIAYEISKNQRVSQVHAGLELYLADGGNILLNNETTKIDLLILGSILSSYISESSFKDIINSSIYLKNYNGNTIIYRESDIKSLSNICMDNISTDLKNVTNKGYYESCLQGGFGFSLSSNKANNNIPMENPSPTHGLNTSIQAEVSLSRIKEFYETSYIDGESDAKFTLIEFCSLQGPFCERHFMNNTVDIVKEGRDNMNSIYSHFPLSFHIYSQKASEALECIGDSEGKEAYFQYRKEIYARAEDPSQIVLEEITKDLGYDLTAFQSCLSNGKFAEKVKQDMDFGRELGVTGTPGNIIINNENGNYIKVSGAVSPEAFNDALHTLETSNTNPGSNYNSNRNIPLDVLSTFYKEIYFKGDKNSLVSIIEFSDMECPFCQRHNNNGTLDEVLANNSNVNIGFAHFPLSFHPNAQKAGEALECAGSLGDENRFFSYRNALFNEGFKPDLKMIEMVAIQEGFNSFEFMECVNDSRFEDKVKNQMIFGQSLGVTGTPGNIVINNKTGEYIKVSGAVPASAFEAPINNYLNE